MKRKSYAKINLILDIVRKRSDGYHDIDGIMQLIDLYDELTIEKSEKFIITSNSKEIPLDNTNLVYKAYSIMKEKYRFSEEFKIHIEKNIPVAAGIAGGSSNAAATIELINDILNLKLKNSEKKEIGKQIGADVPFMLTGKTSRTRGIGEIIDILNPIKETKILIVNNSTEISTKYVYSKIKPSGENNRVEEILKVYNSKDYNKFYSMLYNTMEDVSIEYCPEIQKIKDEMYKHGAIKSLMSGSGPTVFGIFENEEKFDKAYKELKKKYNKTYKTKTIGV